MGSIVLEDISKSYDGKTLSVENFNLTIDDGEFVVFVGPSGCGKSTVLRMIAGLEEITSGDLYIDGQLANNMQPKDRNLAMVFQNYALYPHMTVYDNLAYPLKLQNIGKDEIDKKVREVADMLGIGDFVDKKPGQLSGGQKQRVALGRCMVRDAKAFLMDEPLSNLDAKLRGQMRAEITSLQSRINKTFIYVTHDQIEAMTMADRIVSMRAGHIQQIGSPEELYNKPKNKFVAGFIGNPAMNFLDTSNLQDQDFSFRYDDACLGIRPEHIELGHREGSWNFSAPVLSTEPLGAEKYVRFDLKGQTILCRDGDNNDYVIGQTYDFSVPADKLYYFDKASELALA